MANLFRHHHWDHHMEIALVILNPNMTWNPTKNPRTMMKLIMYPRKPLFLGRCHLKIYDMSFLG
jgi:hypothetical protein